MRLRLKRPTGGWLHHDVEPLSGADTVSVSAPSDVEFTLPAEWWSARASDGHHALSPGGTLVVVEDEAGRLRAPSLVESVSLEGETVQVVAGGIGTLPKDIPWGGRPSQHVSTDPAAMVRTIWEHVQSYPASALGVRVTGATSSDGTMGQPGSAAWYQARRAFDEVNRSVQVWEGRMLTRERQVERTAAEVFRMAGVKRVGSIVDQSSAPDDPTYRADSTVWVDSDTDRAHAWRKPAKESAFRWVSQSQADPAVKAWRKAVNSRDVGKRYLEMRQYQADPAREALESLELEAEEPFELSPYTTLDLAAVVEQAAELGPLEWVERAGWSGDDLDLAIRLGAPRLGARRPGLFFEVGTNVIAAPVVERNLAPTDLLMQGAGEGSETLRTWRAWESGPSVRRVRVVTDKDAHTRALVSAAANREARTARREGTGGLDSVVVADSEHTPLASLGLGDSIYIRGDLADGTPVNAWRRVMSIRREWGTDTATLGLEDE